MYPILQEPVDIAPVAGRVVLFSSTTMLHRVLPSTTTPRGDKRVCATVWLHGDNSYGGAIERRADMTPKPLPDNANSVETALFLLQPYYRPFTCRMLYADVSSTSFNKSERALANIITCEGMGRVYCTESPRFRR